MATKFAQTIFSSLSLSIISVFYTMAFATEVELEPFKTSLDYAQVKNVNATKSNNGTWCVSTQVYHNDEGWSHYATSWQIHDLKGKLLAERKLAHPHDNEQPFTRSLCGIIIPKESKKVIVSAKCNVHGTGGQSLIVELTK